MRTLLAVALLGVLARAGKVDDLLFRARHLQQVQGDLPEAIRLYKDALKHLDKPRQAAVHLRIALCYRKLKQFDLALQHLSEPIYGHEGTNPEVRRRATSERRDVRDLRPRPSPERPIESRVDPERVRLAKLRDQLAQARRFAASKDDIRAYFHVAQALALDPGNAEAKVLESELDVRLSGLSSFLRDQLRLLQSWQEARTVQLARSARALLSEAVRHARAGRTTRAEARFRDALRTIDASEFATESDPLISLRLAIETLWREERRKRGAPPPEIAETRVRSTLRADLLDNLQRILDVISTPDREYRIIPVPPPPRSTEAPPPWRSKPRDFQLLRGTPSGWSAARFARRYLPLRTAKASWRERGHYIEDAGGMLVARNRPHVLDALQAEVRRLGHPDPAAVETSFLVVSVPVVVLERIQKLIGPFRRAPGDGFPLLYRVADARNTLPFLSGFLRGEGADVKLTRDLFQIGLVNGRPQTLFVARPLRSAPGYRDLPSKSIEGVEEHYGLLLDCYPLREASGRTALGLRLTASVPSPPLRLGTGAYAARMLRQKAELFVDLPAGATLVVAGLVDPFAGDREESSAQPQALLLLWRNASSRTPAPGVTDPAPEGPVEISLRELLLPDRVRDDPGPRRDPARGFVAVTEIDALRERAAFLEGLLQTWLQDRRVSVDVEGAVLRVPVDLREMASDAIAELKRQSRRSFVVRTTVRAVRTHVFERWMQREGLELQEFGAGSLAISDAPGGEFLFRNLIHVETDDVFAPRGDLPAIVALGLQARHTIHARIHASPAYVQEGDLATGNMRMVTEGLSITARPYIARGRLMAWLAVETSALDSEVEELALTRAVPSYRTRVSGVVASGTVDFGPPDRPRTALICRLPHPTQSTTERMTEIAIAVSIRALR